MPNKTTNDLQNRVRELEYQDSKTSRLHTPEMNFCVLYSPPPLKRKGKKHKDI